MLLSERLTLQIPELASARTKGDVVKLKVLVVDLQRAHEQEGGRKEDEAQWESSSAA